MTCRIAKGKRRSHATAQRRNVKAQVMGDMANEQIDSDGPDRIFPLAVAPFDDKDAIAHRRIAHYRVA